MPDEHTRVRWLKYGVAYEIIRYPDQKIALYEVNLSLERGHMQPETDLDFCGSLG